MSEGTRNRRETRADFLRERFESNISLIEKTIWQGEKDFTLEIPVNLQNDCVYGKISLMKIYLVRQTKCPKKSWYPLPFHGRCAYQEVRNVCFSEILACFAFLKHPF